MQKVLVREKNGKARSVDVSLTGHENAGDLLRIVGLDPRRHSVKAGRRTLEEDEIVPPHERITVEDNSFIEEPEITWNESSAQSQDKIALTLSTHFGRSPSRVISMEVQPSATPYQLADTLVKRVNGVDPNDLTEMVDERGRNLMEPQYHNQSFGDLGVRSGETLDIQGDITQGL